GGTFRAFVPSLPGCQTWGWQSVTEAQEKLREAIDLYLHALVDAGEEIPIDRGMESIETISMNLANA
ncbi:type II toxin-antitoxin system HicB family antitoxin, partial [Candidatus Uhrbacteria bacterium]|nr:type II toxin-antitoxin system HicB family antitoxin [Candidatus Uhrbacteria bacterium]